MTRTATAVVLLGVTLLSSCSRHQFPTATIGVGEYRMLVEIAAIPEHRSQGLMHRDKLPTNEGMLFLYPEQRPRSFWMKNTRIPLSIAFIDQSGRIVRIAEMAPLDTESTKSLYPAKYALEVNRGWFATNNVATGAMVTDIPETEIR